MPGAPRTSPDVQFSRIRFLGCTRFRADLHSCPLQGPMAIPLLYVGSCYSSPTCPARVSFEGYVLPWGPSPCGWLSQPLTTMPHKTPLGIWLSQAYLTTPCSSIPPEPTLCPGSSPLRVPTLSVSSRHFVSGAFGASWVPRRISSCMPRPDDSAGPPHPRLCTH